jgi:Cyclophilin type peptidyl-prolyl cis-trans isomerase/CLD
LENYLRRLGLIFSSRRPAAFFTFREPIMLTISAPLQRLLQIAFSVSLLAFSTACVAQPAATKAAATEATKPAAGTCNSSSTDKRTQPMVKLHTNHGIITLELDAAKAPITVANFLDYAKSGFYDGTIFHRVIRAAASSQE